MANEVVGAVFDEFSEGGRLDDANVTLVSARWVRWDYLGKSPEVLALLCVFRDGEGNDHPEYMSAGDLKFFVPSSDGMKAVPVGSQTKLNKNTNAIAFLVSLMNADTKGELAAKIRTTDALGSVIDGVQLHVIQKAQPKRSGIIQQPVAEGQQVREKTRIEVDKILAYPGGAALPQTAARPAVAGAPAAAAPAAAAPVNDDLDNATQTALLNIIAANGGSIKVANIAGKLFNDPDMKALSAPERNAILGLVLKPVFLSAAGRPWVHDTTAGTVGFPG